MKREKQNKETDELSGNGRKNPWDPSEKVWGRLWWEGFIEKVSFESGVEQRWSACIVKVLIMMMMMSWWEKKWDDSDRDSSSTGWRSSLGSSFQRRGEAWRKEWLLTFKEECKGGWARVLRNGWREIRSYRYSCSVVVTARAREFWMSWGRFSWHSGRSWQGWARDVKARDRDETETLTSRDRDETFVALETWSRRWSTSYNCNCKPTGRSRSLF